MIPVPQRGPHEERRPACDGTRHLHREPADLVRVGHHHAPPHLGVLSHACVVSQQSLGPKLVPDDVEGEEEDEQGDVGAEHRPVAEVHRDDTEQRARHLTRMSAKEGRGERGRGQRVECRSMEPRVFHRNSRDGSSHGAVHEG